MVHERRVQKPTTDGHPGKYWSHSASCLAGCGVGAEKWKFCDSPALEMTPWIRQITPQAIPLATFDGIKANDCVESGAPALASCSMTMLGAMLAMRCFVCFSDARPAGAFGPYWPQRSIGSSPIAYRLRPEPHDTGKSLCLREVLTVQFRVRTSSPARQARRHLDEHRSWRTDLARTSRHPCRSKPGNCPGCVPGRSPTRTGCKGKKRSWHFWRKARMDRIHGVV